MGFTRCYPRRRVGIFLGICVCVLLMMYKVSYSLYDVHSLHVLESQWHGFSSEEKGDYNFTIVTGLFDIGRGAWWTQTRTYNDYLGHLLQILKMDVNIVIFIEPKGEQFVKQARRGRESRTKIFIVSVQDLEYYPLLQTIKDIMGSKKFQADNINYRKGLPEATDSLYDLVTNSKITLVHEAIHRNPFNSNYFIWLDGGYGHGDASIYPPDGIWSPKHLLCNPGQVTFVALDDLPDHAEELNRLHKMDTTWIAGGLFAGGIKAMENFYKLHKEVMQHYMDRGSIDDDQTTFSDCYFRQPDNFRPVKGWWYDLMKPFR